MSPKPIQIPSTPINPLIALTCHQIGSCTLSYAMWNRTTEFCNSPSFAIPDSGIIETIINILYGSPEYFWGLIDQIVGGWINFCPRINPLGLLAPCISTVPLKFCWGFPLWALFVFFGQHNSEASPSQSINQFCFIFPFSGSGCHRIKRGVIRFYVLIFILWFFDFRVLSQKKFSCKNCVIFHDFIVALFRRHPGHYGTP